MTIYDSSPTTMMGIRISSELITTEFHVMQQSARQE